MVVVGFTWLVVAQNRLLLREISKSREALGLPGQERSMRYTLLGVGIGMIVFGTFKLVTG